MEKSIFLLVYILGITSTFMNAQPIITASNFPENGMTLAYFIGSSKTILDLSGGRERTWDFSRILPEPVSEIGYSNVDNLKDAALFPESNVAFGSANTKSDFSFLKQTKDVVEYLGFVADYKGDLYVARYTDSWIWYSLPLKFNSTFKDTYACHSRLINIGDTIDYFSSGVYSYRVDGFGTVVTSTAKVPNALRVNAIISETDSAVFRNRNDSSSVTHNITNKVSWLSAESGHYSELVSTFDFKDFFFSETLQKEVGISSPAIKTLSIFPDPATTTINIDLRPIGENRAEVTVFNNLGNMVKIFHSDLYFANSGNWSIPVQDLPAGIYYLRIKGIENEWGAKFVKQ